MGEISSSGTWGKRQARSKLERQRIVEETLKPGASVAGIARSHGVNANQVYHWRKLYGEGRLDVAPAELLPVRVEEVASVEPRSGSIRIEFGKARIHIEGSVDHESLRIVLEHTAR